VRTSGKTNSPPGDHNLYRTGSGGGEKKKKNIKRAAKIEPLASLFFLSFGLAHPHASRMYFPFLVK